jgi:molybdenum cofactor cytidylyltransferase
VLTGAVVLAAGASERFGSGQPKQRALFRDRPLLCWSVDAAVASAVGEVAVVGGDVALGDLLPPGVTLLTNAEPAAGIATSLTVAIGWAEGKGLDALDVGLGDQPLVPASAWRAVAGQVESPIAVATYRGRRRNPVRLARSVWPLLPTTGDDGARSLLRRRPELVTEVACEGDPVDIDTEEELARWS